MGKPRPVKIRTRVIGYVDEGHGHGEAARRFRVSPKFVNDLVKLRRETGCLTPRRQGNGGRHGKLVDVTGWLEARVTAKSEITLDDLVAELARTGAPIQGVSEARSVTTSIRAVSVVQESLNRA